MLDHVEDHFIDPSDVSSHPKELINISNGLHASSTVQKSMVSYLPHGRKASKTFVEDRLSSQGKKSIWSPVTRSGLSTFTDMNKPTKFTVASKKVKAAMSAEFIFRRALSLTKSRSDASTSSVVSRPITAVPTMLFKEDGSRQKTSKSDLLTEWLEDHVSSPPSLPDKGKTTGEYIIDGMANIQAVKDGNSFKTFNDLGNKFLMGIRALMNTSDEVHQVYDRYDQEGSIKTEERLARLGGGEARAYAITSGARIPQWKKFLNSLQNKAALANFLSDFLSSVVLEDLAQSQGKFATKTLFISGGFVSRDIAKRVSATGIDICEYLSGSHEEADTRMIFHLMNADKRMKESGCKDVRR